MLVDRSMSVGRAGKPNSRVILSFGRAVNVFLSSGPAFASRDRQDLKIVNA
jgi:hypothetical protein